MSFVHITPMSIGIKAGNPIKKLVVLCGLLMLVVGSMMIADRVWAQSQDGDVVPAADEHVVTIYDRGEERVIVTKAKTVRQALDAAGILINDKQDVVEPGLDSELIASKYNVNIYRARPVTVVDGMVRQRITTAQKTPENIAQVASVELHAEDKVTLEVSDDLLLYGADMVMKIDRAIPLQLTLYGKKTEVRTQADTVGEFLIEKDIQIGENDMLSVATDQPIVAGMQIELWREGKQTITVDEEVDFETEQIRDANRPVGYKQVQTPGEKGARTATYEIEMRNGEEVARQEIASIVTKQPKKQVEVVGTKPETMAYTGGGTKSEWLAASNISPADYGYADWLVQKESGWNPNAVNPYSGACGLGQQLPCGKWPGQWNNPVDSLNGMDGYVKSRYGGWAGAVAHSQSRGWY
ncbi:hypothetical protein B7Y94_03045 [Candidatus Saccharibacteria bacterium 32-49-12]|nr:MAG: hypothetical protein B7Y94_03045 [Candidatus Saccharibacteria bacterium 32-49-12]